MNTISICNFFLITFVLFLVKQQSVSAQYFWGENVTPLCLFDLFFLYFSVVHHITRQHMKDSPTYSSIILSVYWGEKKEKKNPQYVEEMHSVPLLQSCSAILISTVFP